MVQKFRTNLTQTELKSLLKYDRKTGLFTWRVNVGKKIKAGGVAGTIIPSGYVQIGINNCLFLAHRLAYLYVKGCWPPELIDHEDGVRHNNVWSNLRVGNSTFNNQNRKEAPSNSKSGLLGAHQMPGGTFYSRIRAGGKILYLGSFPTAQEAHEAYLAAKRLCHKGNTL